MWTLDILAARAPQGGVFTSSLMTINQPPKALFLQAYFIRQFLLRLTSKHPPSKMTPSGFHPAGPPPSHFGIVRSATCSELSFQKYFTLQTSQEQRWSWERCFETPLQFLRRVCGGWEAQYVNDSGKNLTPNSWQTSRKYTVKDKWKAGETFAIII